ncbi:hypothetical protein ABIQ69_00650 [Agromyces sp. G08B096]|uniref:SbsA Ig-like domain-containing protein n=1 Tax=Agromyces sp. G08B096 TaxID=3156399 RepID=A0AAU7W6U0_9MICO
MATIAVLAAATASLGVAGALQGPRLQTAAVDAERVTQLAGSRVVLELNQPIARVDGSLRVEPDEPAELTVEGDRLIVEFARPLPYDTEVAVTVEGVVGETQPTPATIEHRFTTAESSLHTLVRRSDTGRPDAVVRGSLSGGDPEVVLEAPRLLSFAEAADVVVAVAIEDDELHTLRVAGVGQETQTLRLPEPGHIRSIAGSTTNPIVAFVLDGAPRPGGVEPAYRNALFTLDVSGQTAAPAPVLGLGGAPMRVMDWRFVPGTTSLVVQDFDGALFLVDALGLTPPAPLGVHSELRGFVPGTTDLVVADPDRGLVIDLETGDARENVLPAAELPDNAYPGRVEQLDLEGTHALAVLLTTTADDGTVQAQSLLAVAGPEGTAVRYATGARSRLLGYCVSPNGRYAAVETADVDAESDGYPNAPAMRDRLTTVVDLADGAIVRTQSGGGSDWCG